jgi:hypothetical protein
MTNIISHLNTQENNIERLEKNILSLQKTYLPITEELEILGLLQEFPLGQFLINNRGLNGYWTDYLISKCHENITHKLEYFLLNSCPGILATRERFNIFQEEIKKHIKAEDNVASIPSGLMSDFLTLEKSIKDKLNMYAVDLDKNSLQAIKQQSTNTNVNLIHQDAWDLNFNNFFDLIASNGLNIYEKDHEKLISLYQKFYDALKKDGILIISFLTSPPSIDSKSPWKNYNDEHLRIQRAIFEDILSVMWANYQTEDSMREKMESIGFEVLNVIYDSQGMFPTITLKKL